MRRLYHHSLSPLSRAVRVAALEKRLTFEMREHAFWERNETFLALNPAGEVPVLVEEDGPCVCDGLTVLEYLEDAYPDTPLLPRGAAARAEARRLVGWFAGKFRTEVGDPLVTEKLFKRLIGGAAPDSRAVRAGRANIHTHLHYITWLTERRKWLAGDALTLADLTAAAHLSLVDYTADIPWTDHPDAKDWYARIKCRPSFRPLLRDAIPGVPPPRHYDDLDF